MSLMIYPDGLGARFHELFDTYRLSDIYANARADTHALDLPHSDVVIPLTITNHVQPNCFTIAPHAAIVDYGRDEVVKLPTWQQYPLKTSLATISHYLRLAKIDKVVAINNYGLSTNTLSPAFMAINPVLLRKCSIDKYPKHALLIRSLNRHHHADYMDRLCADGWHFVTSRQVYVYDDIQTCYHHKGMKRDKKLATDGQYTFVTASHFDDYQMAKRWYDKLYLDKYSMQNVQFTALGLQALHRLGIIHLELLIDNHTQRDVGVVGVVSGDGIVTAPVVGYDTDISQKSALYRRVIARAMALSDHYNLPLNLSSGAPSFKRLRGGVPVIEYTAVYIRHLPRYRQLPWLMLHKASPHYAQLLKYYEL